VRETPEDETLRRSIKDAAIVNFGLNIRNSYKGKNFIARRRHNEERSYWYWLLSFLKHSKVPKLILRDFVDLDSLTSRLSILSPKSRNLEYLAVKSLPIQITIRGQPNEREDSTLAKPSIQAFFLSVHKFMGSLELQF
jgi:hypothetical protein